MSQLQPVTADQGQPLYEAVKVAVRDAVNTGVFAPGERLPSTKALSERFEVSLVTVHRALQELVASGVLRRGQGRGTFVHEDFDDHAEETVGWRFGLVFHAESSLADSYHGQILEGVRRRTGELGIDLVLLRFGEDWRNECQAYLYVNPFAAQLDRPMRFGAGRMSRNGAPPAVVIGASFDRPGFTTIDTDNVGIGARAAQHLYELGHRRIAYLGGDERVSNSADRWRGFSSECERLDIEPAGVVRSAGWRLDDDEARSLRRMLASEPLPTAVFASGYYFALDVYRAACELGLSIPDDLSIVAVDDPPSAAYLSPPLTTFRQPLIDLGMLAADRLVSLIDQPDLASEHRTLAANLVVRGSTGAIGRTAVAAQPPPAKVDGDA